MTGPFAAPAPGMPPAGYELASRISPGPFFLVRNTGLAGIKVSEAFLRVRIWKVSTLQGQLWCVSLLLFYLRYEQHPACLRHFSQTEWLQGVFLRSGNISAIPSLPSFQLVLILSESRNGWLCKMWISCLQIHVVFRCQIFLDLLF